LIFVCISSSTGDFLDLVGIELLFAFTIGFSSAAVAATVVFFGSFRHKLAILLTAGFLALVVVEVVELTELWGVRVFFVAPDPPDDTEVVEPFLVGVFDLLPEPALFKLD